MAAFRAVAKAELDPLQKQANLIAHKRAIEAARQERIFNVKYRTIGVHTDLEACCVP